LVRTFAIGEARLIDLYCRHVLLGVCDWQLTSDLEAADRKTDLHLLGGVHHLHEMRPRLLPDRDLLAGNGHRQDACERAS